MIIKLKYDDIGGFHHVDVFAGTNPEALGKIGELIFREMEWEAFKYLLRTGESVQDMQQEYIELVIVTKDVPL